MGFADTIRERRGLVAVDAPPGEIRIPIDQIRPNPDQPRREIDEAGEAFQELRASIWTHGLIQPVCVWQPDTSVQAYVLIAGERRWRAFRSLMAQDPERFGSIPALIRRELRDGPDLSPLVLGLLENVVREDLAPGDRAAAVARIKELTGWTFTEMSQHLGISVTGLKGMSAIAQSEDVVDALNAGQLTQRQAVAVAQAAQGDMALAAQLVGAVARAPRRRIREVIDSVKDGGDGSDGSAADEEVLALRHTALSALKPRVTTIERGRLRVLLRKALRELAA